MEPTLFEYVLGNAIQVAIPAIFGGGLLILALNLRKKKPPEE